MIAYALGGGRLDRRLGENRVSCSKIDFFVEKRASRTCEALAPEAGLEPATL